jgi:hypothetical protein
MPSYSATPTRPALSRGRTLPEAVQPAKAVWEQKHDHFIAHPWREMSAPLPAVEPMVPSALTPSEREADQPQDEEHYGYHPQEVRRESQAGEEQNHKKGE